MVGNARAFYGGVAIATMGMVRDPRDGDGGADREASIPLVRGR